MVSEVTEGKVQIFNSINDSRNSEIKRVKVINILTVGGILVDILETVWSQTTALVDIKGIWIVAEELEEPSRSNLGIP